MTVSCPLLPSYAAKAATSAAALFDARAAEKNAKHLPGCAQLGRALLAIVFTSLHGIGPAPAAGAPRRGFPLKHSLQAPRSRVVATAGLLRRDASVEAHDGRRVDLFPAYPNDELVAGLVV